MKKFDSINVGDKAELTHRITLEDINKFVDLTGDDNKLHIDAEYAKTTSFKKPVAHGMLGASFISTIIGTKIPGDGALWFSQTIEFLLPVRVGDELTVIGEVIKKNVQANSIELQTDIFNQHKQKVTTGIAKVKIVEQEEPENIEVAIPFGKNALIIGGTGGIGKASCVELAKNGFNVAVHYMRNKEEALKIQNEVIGYGVKCCIVKGDATLQEDVKEIVDKSIRALGRIDILINCSTLKIPNLKFEKVEWSDIENHFNINVKSSYYLAQALVPVFKEQKYGKFIFLTSQVTESTPPTEWSFYTIGKYALNGFAKSLAVELAPFNIMVNLVSPGMTETDLVSDIPERSKMLIAAKTPLRRLAQAVDIANVICFLSSEKANYITGETVRINGGQIMI